MLGSLFYPDRPSSDPGELQRFVAEREIATWLDQQDPGEGTVLADSAYAYPIIVNSAEPQTFVIPSDYDFRSSLEDPRAQGIKYILVQSDTPADAVQARWPTLFDNGADIGNLVRTWDGVGWDGSVHQWRLYEV